MKIGTITSNIQNLLQLPTICTKRSLKFMYNLQEIAKRIKSKAKTNGTNLKTMFSDCELGINTISQMSKGNDILSKNLARIADYLDCSVDYLLGRTDNPNINR